MATIKVPVKVVTIVHKDTKETYSKVGDDDITSDSFEDTIFGESFNCTGFWKAISACEKAGHKVITTNTEVEVQIP